jgi:hypothetical protein
LEIIGKDSPVIDGLDIGETDDPVVANPQESPCPRTPSQIPRELSASKVTSDPSPTENRSRTWKDINNEEIGVKRKLQCELMQIKLYKHKLEVMKLERELSLPPSTYATDVLDNVNYNVSE